MSERVKCPLCQQRVALSKSGRIKGHGSARFSHNFAAGMNCGGSGITTPAADHPTPTPSHATDAQAKEDQ